MEYVHFMIGTTLFFLLAYVMASVMYQLVLAAAYFLIKHPEYEAARKRNSFAIIVPSHDEELLISKTCENLVGIDYPAAMREVFIVADNCSDSTADICSAFPVNVLCRTDKENAGKGYALKWAFEQLDLARFDAVLILDADTTVDPEILLELNTMLERGSQAIQCYETLSNRGESWFTQLIFVSRTINNLLYHCAKYKLGLSSYLMGVGMCFRTSLLREVAWNAYTLSEDWEYTARLIENDKRIDFAVRARVFPQESRSLRQATSQRLRWSKGRYHVVKNLGLRLFAKGLRKTNLRMMDASLPLVFPNWSLQINLILLALLLGAMLPASAFKTAAIALAVAMLCAQGLILLVGVFLAGDYWRVFKAVLVAPVFLVWKFGIDFLSMTGIYRGKKWIRTARHLPEQNK
jgi:cellulose synthase/poly-beta-1,6-N-acetylglucosamine synthase-like glycosyltransferase